MNFMYYYYNYVNVRYFIVLSRKNSLRMEINYFCDFLVTKFFFKF